MSVHELGGLADRRYDGALLERELTAFVAGLELRGNRRPIMGRANRALLELLDGRRERTLQDRWEGVERELWPEWAGRDWTLRGSGLGAGCAGALPRGAPGWVMLSRARLSQWLGWLPAGHPLPARYARLGEAVAAVEWASDGESKRRAALLGLRILLANGHTELEHIRAEDLQAVPGSCARGIDVLVCIWSTEAGSPFAGLAPPAVPLERRDLVGIGFDKARRQRVKRQAETVLDLERAIPNIRAVALLAFDRARQALAAAPVDRAAVAGEVDAFWDWALLELLLQSGVRIEEASS